MGNGLRLVLDWQGHAKPVEKTDEPHYEGRQESVLDVKPKCACLVSRLACEPVISSAHAHCGD